jgi:hypothetical protein
MAHIVDHLPRKCEALSSNPSISPCKILSIISGLSCVLLLSDHNLRKAFSPCSVLCVICRITGLTIPSYLHVLSKTQANLDERRKRKIELGGAPE